MSTIVPPPEEQTPKPPRAAPVPTADDHLPGSRRVSARRAIGLVLAACAILVVCDGDGMRRQAEKMDRGTERDLVLAVAKPAGWIADHLPFSSAVDEMTGWLSPDEDLGNEDGNFSAPASAGSTRVTPQAFDPQALGIAADRRPALKKLLVTGDSMSQPMDAELARTLTEAGVQTKRDPKFGTGISKTDLLDWGRYAGLQARRESPDATVVLLGANEGFPMKGPDGKTLEYGTIEWAAEYATRVRTMMAAYGRNGAGRVYWLLVPPSNDGERNEIISTVNAAIRVAAGAYGAQVRVIDLPAILAPGGRYSSSLEVDGRKQVVRDPDGTHLNEVGARLAADEVRKVMARDFDLGKAAP